MSDYLLTFAPLLIVLGIYALIWAIVGILRVLPPSGRDD